MTKEEIEAVEKEANEELEQLKTLHPNEENKHFRVLIRHDKLIQIIRELEETRKQYAKVVGSQNSAIEYQEKQLQEAREKIKELEHWIGSQM